MTNTELKQILHFLHSLEELKSILRFKNMPYWEDVKIDRWDSVAEHSYRMAVMAILLSQDNESPLNLEKVLKMILIHDWVEVMTGDEFPFTKTANGYTYINKPLKSRSKVDLDAFDELSKHLPEKLCLELKGLFLEFVNAQSNKPSSIEASFAVALDRMESTLTCIEYRKKENFWKTEHKKNQKEYLNSKLQFTDQNLKMLAILMSDEMDKIN